MQQNSAWVRMTTYPPADGWYLVKGETGKPYAMYFRKEKRSYSDSQWYVESNTGHCWKGLLPEYWLELFD